MVDKSLILSTVEEIVSCMFGQKRQTKSESFCCQKIIVLLKIEIWPVISKTNPMKVCGVASLWFAIQVDKSTDIAKVAQLLVFMCGKFQDAI